MWLSQSNLLSALWSPTASVPAPTPPAAIISMERYFISCCWLFSPQSPRRLWSDTFFKLPNRACGLAASAHHRLQSAADTHSAAALIKKSAASKVSQSKSGGFKKQLKVQRGGGGSNIPRTEKEGGGTNQERKKLHMAERWRQEWLRNVSLKVSLWCSRNHFPLII